MCSRMLPQVPVLRPPSYPPNVGTVFTTCLLCHWAPSKIRCVCSVNDTLTEDGFNMCSRMLPQVPVPRLTRLMLGLYLSHVFVSLGTIKNSMRL